MGPRLVRFTTAGFFGPRGRLRCGLQSMPLATSCSKPANSAAVIATNRYHADCGTAIIIPWAVRLPKCPLLVVRTIPSS